MLRSLIRVYTVRHSQQFDWVYTVCNSKSDQGLQYLPFWTVWSGSSLFALISLIRLYTIRHSQQSDHGLHYLPFFLSSIIKVYTVCHSKQSDQSLQYLSFSSVWSGSPLFAIISLFRVYTFCQPQHLIGVYTIWHSFQAVLSRSTLFAILSSMIRVLTISMS